MIVFVLHNHHINNTPPLPLRRPEGNTMTKLSTLKAWRNEGQEANERGEPRSANPHAEETDAHRAWNAGWCQAQDVREQWEADNNDRAQPFAD